MPIRGGNWNNSNNAGVFYLNLTNSRTNSNTNIGFRAALPQTSDASNLLGPMPEQGDKGACLHADRRQKIA